MSWKERLIVALDVPDTGKALEVVDRLGDDICLYKVGFELFVAGGPDFVRRIHEKGKRVFLDLKFHDIPNTVSKAAVAAARLGVFMFNVHASGGYDMMARCRDTVDEACAKEGLARPRIIAVTVLTSLNDDNLKNDICVPHGVKAQVRHLASITKKAGLDGVVASPRETLMIRELTGSDFLIVTPGIRPSWQPPDDQQRTATPQQAVRDGADYIVMGRAILGHEDPARAVEIISLEMLTARRV
jgi:orotidine-5'-phosphate decarboxylase